MEIKPISIWESRDVVLLWAKLMEEIDVIPPTEQAELFYLRLIKDIYNPRVFNFIAVKEKEVIGFVHGYTYIEEHSGLVIGRCEMIYVKIEERNSGIGDTLLKKLSEEMHKEVKIDVEEFVCNFNERAKVYRKLKDFKPERVIIRKKVR